MEILDYQIFQRDENGNAEVLWEYNLSKEFDKKQKIFVSIFRETDNLQILEWKEADICDKRFQIKLILPEGGLYRIEACHAILNGNGLEWKPRFACIRHVGVGEVFVLAGQSNMAGYGRDMAYDPPCLGVHLYGNNGKWDIAAHPLNDACNTIYPENAEYTSGTSPALSFGRRLKEILGVPIGLVQASLGGSGLKSWYPEEDGRLYYAMLRRLKVVGRIRGILWYQGCTDAENPTDAARYLERFCRMTEIWRQEIGDFWFLTVQLNRKSGTDIEMQRNWAAIQEAQRLAGKILPHVCVIPSYDVTMSDAIHNSSGANVILGERMALVASVSIYKGLGKVAPSLECVEKIDNTHIRLIFQKGIPVTIDSKEAEGLYIEDSTGCIQCVHIEKSSNSLELTTSRAFSIPAKFHAYWKCQVPAFPIHDTFGLPMLACYGVKVRDMSLKGEKCENVL